MKSIKRNEQAQAGVGTLIIFIAMVLVAAVAAAVLIQTSGVMQSKSTSTTKEAAAAIGENLVVEAVDGVSDASTPPKLIYTNITIKLAAGGSDLDLTKLMLKVKTATYNYSSTTVSASTFMVYILRDPDGGMGDINTYSATSSVLKPGSLARIEADVSGLTDMTSRKAVTISLTPEKGATFNLPLSLPAIAASKPDIAIYP